jgi:hypothetical protein
MAEELFQTLPAFPPSLPDEELALLRSLPLYDSENQTVREIDADEERVARRLERKGLIKVHRWKDDPLAIRPTLYAGRLSIASLRAPDHRESSNG